MLKSLCRLIDETLVRLAVVACFGAAGFCAGMVWWMNSPQPTWATVCWVVGGFAGIGLVAQSFLPRDVFRGSDKKE